MTFAILSLGYQLYSGNDMTLFQPNDTPCTRTSNNLSHFVTSKVYFISSFLSALGLKNKQDTGLGVSTHSAMQTSMSPSSVDSSPNEIYY
jgi:hypothetical protein